MKRPEAWQEGEKEEEDAADGVQTATTTCAIPGNFSSRRLSGHRARHSSVRRLRRRRRPHFIRQASIRTPAAAHHYHQEPSGVSGRTYLVARRSPACVPVVTLAKRRYTTTAQARRNDIREDCNITDLTYLQLYNVCLPVG